MTNEELEIIKRRYELMVSKKKELKTIKKQYELSLCANMSYKNILYIASNSVNIKESNKIYVYMGTYELGDKLVNRNDENALYSLYRDIELKGSQIGYEIIIPINNRELFEKENNIVYPPNNNYNEFYNKVRDYFFEQSINISQEKAKNKILEINNLI